MKYIITTLSIILLCISCTYKIELPINEKTGKLYIEMFPIAELTDSTLINIYSTRPANKSPKEIIEPIIQSVSIKSDGKVLEVKRLPNLKTRFYVKHKFSPGEVISLNVKAENFPPIKSKTIIPDKVKYKVNSKLVNKNRVHYTISFSDAENKSNIHYGVMMRRRDVYEEWDNTTSKLTTKSQYINLKTEVESSIPSTTNEIPGYKSLTQYYLDDKKLTILEHPNKMDCEITLSIFIDYNHYVSRSLSGWERLKHFYEIIVMSIDDDTYRYMNSKENFYIMSTGFVPPMSNPGNIQGGYGILGAMESTSTGWLENIDTTMYN